MRGRDEMKKNCHNCKHGHWDSEDFSRFYFVCEKRDDGDNIELETNLARPVYLEKSKICCDLKDPGAMVVDLECPECHDTYAGYARDQGSPCFGCYADKHFD